MTFAFILALVAQPALADSSTTCRQDSGGHLICKRVERNPPRRCTTTCRADSAGKTRCTERCR
jgi:hypothetical protein